jgi:glycosyltransferase involved in cell wall biosynthesis
MRIGIVINGFDPESGGSFTFKSSIVRALEQENCNHEFLLLDFSKNELESEFTFPRMKVRRHFEKIEQVNKPTIEVQKGAARNWSFWTRLTKSESQTETESETDAPPADLREHLSDAIQANQIELVWFLEQITEVVPVPFFFTVWDLQHRIQPWFPEVSSICGTWIKREKMYNSMLKRASLVLTGTSVGKREIMHFYGVHESNVDVIPLPVSDLDVADSPMQCQAVRKKYGLQGEFLLYPAQFWAHKNHTNLLLSLQILYKRRGYAPVLVLVGSNHGNRDLVARRIEELDLSHQVKMLGFVPFEDLIALYKTAESLVFVSYFGPDNIPPLEAFRLKCPVIASDVPGAREQLGNATILVNPAEPEEIADAIWSVHHDEIRRKEMISLGQINLAGKSPSDYVSRVIDHFDRFETISRNWRN